MNVNVQTFAEAAGPAIWTQVGCEPECPREPR